MNFFKTMNYLNKLIILTSCALFFTCDSDIDTVEELVTAPSDGYVLYAFMGDTTIHLIDTLGNDVKTWTSSNRTSGAAYLSKTNNLLRLGTTPEANTGVFSGGGAVGGLIEELNSDSDVVWSIRKEDSEATFHHDFKEIDAQNIVALSWELVNYNGNIYWNENILWIDKTSNEVIWSWSAIDDGELTPNATSQKDFLHFNAVDYKDGEILVSSRSQNSLYIINKESKTITASLTANGILSGQHDATFLENGNILVFNNNAGPNASEVLELSRSDEIAWSYSNDFYSNHISGVSRLDNGNTIICSGVEARFIEVTESGQEVWDFIPEHTVTFNSEEIFKIRKYTSY